MPWDHVFRNGCDCCKADGVSGYVNPLFLGVVVWAVGFCGHRCFLNRLMSFAKRMVLSLGFQVHFSRNFWVLRTSEIFSFAAHLDSSNPNRFSFVLGNPDVSRGVVPPLAGILSLLCRSGQPEVIPLVVSSIPVFMIDLPVWPASSNIEPCHNVSQAGLPANAKAKVAVTVATNGLTSVGELFPLRKYLARENSCSRLIKHMVSEGFGSYVFFHALNMTRTTYRVKV